jgi:hypothetical protein
MQKTKYTSDAMNFINTLLQQPGNHEKQMQLRSTWWDKEFVDQQEQKSYAESAVKNEAYTYFHYPVSK